jgi:hypothetical protein
MNSKLLAALLTGAVVLSGAATAASADDFHRVTMTLTNNSGYTIAGLFLSSTNKDTWGPNVLRSQVLPSGYKEMIWTPRGDYDLLLVDQFGDKCEVRDIDLGHDLAVSISRMDLLHCEGY